LSVESLIELCSIVPFLLVFECPDNAGPNKRKMYYTATLWPKNLFYLPGGCVVHSCHRIIMHIGSCKLMGDIYALVFTLLLSSHRIHVWNTLRALVYEECIVVVFLMSFRLHFPLVSNWPQY
jgi:hypothetical protein